MTVRTSTTVGPTIGVADEGNLPDRIAVLIGVIVALVGPETETRRRVAAMMMETVLTDTDVKDRIGDRVAPDAEMILRQTVVTSLTTAVHGKMMTASKLVLPRNDCQMPQKNCAGWLTAGGLNGWLSGLNC